MLKRDLSGQDLVALIKKMNDDVRVLKSKQLVGGDGARMFRPQTDWLELDPEGVSVKKFRIKFSTDNTNDLTGLVFRLFVIVKWEYGSGYASIHDYSSSFIRKPPNKNLQVWEPLGEISVGSDDAYLKVYVISLIDGQVEIEYIE